MTEAGTNVSSRIKACKSERWLRLLCTRSNSRNSSLYRAEITAQIKAAKFKKTVVNTVARDGQTPVVLTGVAHAGLIVHPTTTKYTEGYQVSHVASGKCLGTLPFKTQTEAKAVAVRLAALGDWLRSSDDIGNDVPLAKASVALMCHCRSHGAFTPLI